MASGEIAARRLQPAGRPGGIRPLPFFEVRFRAVRVSRCMRQLGELVQAVRVMDAEEPT
jgi:hypothetical protein